MHYLLLGVSFCYFQLNLKEKSDIFLEKALDIFKNLSNNKEFGNISSKREEYINLRNKIDLSSKTNISPKKQHNTDHIWQENNDLGLDLRTMKDYNDALSFYQEKLSKLTHEVDAEKRI